jgi:hypothetical protein
MKHLARLALVAVIVVAASTAAVAQSIQSAWFAQLSAGMGAHDNGPFSRRLQSYTPRQDNGERFLYQTEALTNVGYSLGAAFGYMIDGGVLVGASGEIVMFPTIEAITAPGNERDEYVLGGWDGGIDIGYVVINEDKTIVYPYLHGGLASYSLEYTNRQDDSIPFFEGKPVPPGTTATYTGSAPRIGLGIGFNSFVGGGPVGGVIVGARVLYGRMLTHPEWEEPSGGTVNNGGHTPCYNAVTLSVSLGFGGGR